MIVSHISRRNDGPFYLIPASFPRFSYGRSAGGMRERKMAGEFLYVDVVCLSLGGAIDRGCLSSRAPRSSGKCLFININIDAKANKGRKER